MIQQVVENFLSKSTAFPAKPGPDAGDAALLVRILRDADETFLKIVHIPSVWITSFVEILGSLLRMDTQKVAALRFAADRGLGECLLAKSH